MKVRLLISLIPDPESVLAEEIPSFSFCEGSVDRF